MNTHETFAMESEPSAAEPGQTAADTLADQIQDFLLMLRDNVSRPQG